jgi:hypothetical protein
MEDIKRKILALMAKTTDNGCSEAEAMMAAEKVQSMLNQYQLSLSDIKLKESKCVTGDYDTQLRAAAPTEQCVTAVAYFTDTKCWQSTEAGGFIHYKFFGLEHDVMIAEYIMKVCDWAIIYEGEDFKNSDVYAHSPNRSRSLKDFRYAMAVRIGTRLREMKDAQNRANASDGRSLVVVKGAIVTDEFAKLNLRLNRAKGGAHTYRDAAAMNAGQAAANRVNINPGVSDRAQRRPELT